jgi:hypothetical protein
LRVSLLIDSSRANDQSRFTDAFGSNLKIFHFASSTNRRANNLRPTIRGAPKPKQINKLSHEKNPQASHRSLKSSALTEGWKRLDLECNVKINTHARHSASTPPHQCSWADAQVHSA